MGTASVVTSTHDGDAGYALAGEAYRLAIAQVVVVLGRVAGGTATAGELTAAVAAKDAAATAFTAAYRDRGPGAPPAPTTALTRGPPTPAA